MGISNFVSFVKSMNEPPYVYGNNHNVIYIDGTFLKYRTIDKCRWICENDFMGKHLFNIHHIYQFMCLKSAIMCFQLIFKLITKEVKEIVVFMDNQSPTFHTKLMQETHEVVPRYLKSLFDKKIDIKSTTRENRKNGGELRINNNPININILHQKVDEELSTGKLGPYVNYVRTSPFAYIYSSQGVTFVILSILCYILETRYPNIKTSLVKAFIEADFNIYNMVYKKYKSNSDDNILIYSGDSDYFICGYHPRVYIYNATEFFYPYGFWSKYIFNHYDNSVCRIELLLRVSFILGNDYFKQHLLNRKVKHKLNDIYIMLNINKCFKRFVANIYDDSDTDSSSEGERCKDMSKMDTMKILQSSEIPFSPEVIDLLIISTIPFHHRIIYVTCLNCVKSVIYDLDRMYVIQDNTFDTFDIKKVKKVLHEEITHEFLLAKNHYEGENPFLIRMYDNNHTLADILSDNTCQKISSSFWLNSSLFKKEISIEEMERRKDVTISTKNPIEGLVEKSTFVNPPFIEEKELLEGYEKLIISSIGTKPQKIN